MYMCAVANLPKSHTSNGGNYKRCEELCCCRCDHNDVPAVEFVQILCICFSRFLMPFCVLFCLLLKVWVKTVVWKSPLHSGFLFVWCCLFNET